MMMNFTACILHQMLLNVINSRRMRWAGHVARMGEGEVFTGFWLGAPKRPLGRPGRRWEDNIKLDLREIGIDGANWIQLAQNRVQWRAFLSNESLGPIKKAGYCLTS
jgi:hypothetical protein